MMHPFTASQPLPTVFPNPFDAPHPLAQAAARDLQARLPALSEGKMFGVLVVETPTGELGQLWAFSGMWGDWRVPGFVAPAFSEAAQAEFWPAGQAALAEDGAHIDALAERLKIAEAEVNALQRGQAEALAELKETLTQRRKARRLARKRGEDAHLLDQESRGDTASLRQLKATHRATLAEPLEHLEAAEALHTAATGARTQRSNGLWAALHATYRLCNLRGEQRALTDLFAPHVPPAGAGDCAAPKLLAAAYRQGLRPVALAEFWWGPAPPGGGRWQGHYYPACRGRCGVILPFMLTGLPLAPAPQFEDDTPQVPTTLYEDDAIWVVNKPAGLLSVPGRGRKPTVLSMLDRPDFRLVHRLDLDTSGALIIAKSDTHCIALQRQFAQHSVHKRYVAILDGVLKAEGGEINLALRPDPLDRPRQIHHPDGRAAVTRWQRLGERRVALFPKTGRTHQLRVHCAHPLGLATPIRGDRIYGQEAARLHLHAAQIAFEHPVHGRRVEVFCPPPF